MKTSHTVRHKVYQIEHHFLRVLSYKDKVLTEELPERMREFNKRSISTKICVVVSKKHLRIQVIHPPEYCQVALGNGSRAVLRV